MESVPLNLPEVVCDGGCILYLRWCVQSHGAMNECIYVRMQVGTLSTCISTHTMEQ